MKFANDWLLDEDGDFVALAYVTMIFAEKKPGTEEGSYVWVNRVKSVDDEYTHLPGTYPTQKEAQQAISELLMSFADKDQA